MDEVRPGQKLDAAQAMRLAIREGRRGTGFVAPNPLVGCVILDSSGRLLAVGHHARVGFDHAEAAAIKKVRDRKKLIGSHFFVTLEPCAHQGRTPSCASAIAPLKPASVTYAVEDPYPLVSGRGAAILREAGVKTLALSERGDIDAAIRKRLVADAEALAEIFLYNQRTGLPFIAVKLASSLDGQIGFKNGESKWITGEAAREHSHLVRARYDAVGVGVRTFETDDPSLDIRHARFPDLGNKAVIFDPSGKSLARLPGSKLFRARGAENVLVVVGSGVKLKTGAQLVPVSLHDGRFVIDELLGALKSAGITSLMIEGGAQTIGAFFEARRVQRLHAYLAPSIFGGRNGIGWSAGFGVSKLSERIQLEGSRRRVLGDDLYWTARVR